MNSSIQTYQVKRVKGGYAILQASDGVQVGTAKTYRQAQAFLQAAKVLLAIKPYLVA